MEECENDIQCKKSNPFSHCDNNNRCSCMRRFHEFNKTCHSLIGKFNNNCCLFSACFLSFDITFIFSKVKLLYFVGSLLIKFLFNSTKEICN